jgi:transcriptional antiterminator NusG
MSKQKIDEGRNWYVIHTYAGYENAVARNLKQRIESLGMENKIFAVIVPTEKKIKIKGSKRVEEEEKIYPGYILVDMIVTDDSWYVVRNTPRVTGFVGSGVYPVPIDKAEIDSLFKRMNADTPKHNIDLDVDDQIQIVDGPFKDLEGKVSEVDEERGKVKVLVNMFGRETPVELDFLQIKKIKKFNASLVYLVRNWKFLWTGLRPLSKN